MELIWAIIFGIMWSYGGWEHGWKPARALLALFLPVVAMVLAGGYNQTAVYSIPAYWLLMGVSYGETCPNGKFWSWLLRRPSTEPLCQVMIRVTCGVLWALPAVFFSYYRDTPEAWLLLGTHIVFLGFASAFLGTQCFGDRCLPARIEEFLIGVCFVYLPLRIMTYV